MTTPAAFRGPSPRNPAPPYTQATPLSTHPTRFPRPRPLRNRPHPYVQAPPLRTRLPGVLKPSPLRTLPPPVRSGPSPQNLAPPGLPDPPPQNPTPTDILTPCPSEPCPGCRCIWGRPPALIQGPLPHLRLRRSSRKPATPSCGTSTWATCSPAHLTWAPGCVEACM